MAERVPDNSTGSSVGPQTLFSFKTVCGKFIAEPTEPFNALDEGKREQCHGLLNTFNDALAKVTEKGYDPKIIGMLIMSNTQLVLFLPNKKIEELEDSLAPLRHELSAYRYLLENDVVSTDVQSHQHALGNFFKIASVAYCVYHILFKSRPVAYRLVRTVG